MQSYKWAEQIKCFANNIKFMLMALSLTDVDTHEHFNYQNYTYFQPVEPLGKKGGGGQGLGLLCTRGIFLACFKLILSFL